MSMMEIAIRCNMYVATFIKRSTKKDTSKAGWAMLHENGGTPALDQCCTGLYGGSYARVLLRLKFTGLIHLFTTNLKCRFSLPFDLNLEDVEPLDSLAKSTTKWFLNKLALYFNELLSENLKCQNSHLRAAHHRRNRRFVRRPSTDTVAVPAGLQREADRYGVRLGHTPYKPSSIRPLMVPLRLIRLEQGAGLPGEPSTTPLVENSPTSTEPLTGKKRKRKSSDSHGENKTKSSKCPRSQEQEDEEPSHQEPTQDPGEMQLGGVQQVVITAIHATDLTLGLRRIPAGFHVVVKTDGAECQTSNKSVNADQAAVECDERILL
ncbi:uncharacterized protein F5891DRAFT_1200406 [Suillus fuscotomentosus]|uniref:Uncharacterized protein n=1 Tax=Suillus fuscotomentosus TaxID=1912939 RepID=A0AAD4DNV0_9AGAM|nr:uncharacterized protein F5891DRAFT_1200406 [Suillus fuscotomentosus]KAG1886902.1 hypothetical protein F5891DRAFT_1200406 [Suillus fuscotomentosus]